MGDSGESLGKGETGYGKEAVIPYLLLVFYLHAPIFVFESSRVHLSAKELLET